MIVLDTLAFSMHLALICTVRPHPIVAYEVTINTLSSHCLSIGGYVDVCTSRAPEEQATRNYTTHPNAFLSVRCLNFCFGRQHC